MHQHNVIKVSHIPIYDDNYVWLIHLPAPANPSKSNDNAVIVVDPGDASAVIRHCEQHDLQPVAIFITHSHWDHVTGLEEVHHRYSIPVYAPEHPNIPVITYPVFEGSEVNVGALTFKVWSLPGHLPEHVAYLAQLNEQSPVQIFSGDVMFSAGCGRIFVGSHAELKGSLDRINSLPEDTYVYGTHEYTQANLRFAQAVEPNNLDIQSKIREVNELRGKGLASLPTQLWVERLINPYLRCGEMGVVEAARGRLKREPVGELDVFTCIRDWKNVF